MHIPFVDLSRQFIANEKVYTDIFTEVGRSGMFILGSAVQDFEANIAKYCGTKYALGVANGTDGLILILRALDIGPGDEVITAPNSYIASAGAIGVVGADIVFADVKDDLNIDPEDIKKRITDKTKAIIAVHLTGRVADMNAINAIAKKHNIYVIEDSAQAIGASYHGQKAGSFGIAASFSLHPLKNLNVLGDGGFISTNSTELYKRISRMRNHGLEDRDSCLEWGLNSRLDAIQAKIASFNLTQIDAWNERFREIASLYREGLRDVVTVPEDKKYERNVYHNFVIYTNQRDELMRHLSDRGVETKIHYPILLHHQKAALKDGQNWDRYPIAEKLSKKMMSLPIYPFLTDREVQYVCESIREFYI